MKVPIEWLRDVVALPADITTEAIADRLGVHVSTIRYRLARLRELFGDDLDDPEARFELALALRAHAGRSPH